MCARVCCALMFSTSSMQREVNLSVMSEEVMYRAVRLKDQNYGRVKAVAPLYHILRN